MKKEIPIILGTSIIIKLILYVVSVGSPPLQPRILKEIRDLQRNPIDGIVVTPRENNARHFDVEMNGPKDSPYEGGVFKLQIILPNEYPLKAPQVKFLTVIYHPNIVRPSGEICLDILQDNWSPVNNIRSVLISIQSILSTDPFGGLPTSEIEVARRYTQLHAIRPSSESGSSSQPPPLPQQPSSSPMQLQFPTQTLPPLEPAPLSDSASLPQSASPLQRMFLLQRAPLQRAFQSQHASHQAQALSQLEPSFEPSSSLIGSRRDGQSSPQPDPSPERQSSSEAESSSQSPSPDTENTPKRRRQS